MQFSRSKHRGTCQSLSTFRDANARQPVASAKHRELQAVRETGQKVISINADERSAMKSQKSPVNSSRKNIEKLKLRKRYMKRL